jgi:hypothetical protein
LVEAVDFGMLFFESFTVFQGDLFPSHFPQDDIEVEKKDL